MSIKTKIPILIFLMLFINLVILFLYYHFVFYEKLADRIKKFSGITISKNILRQNRMVHELLGFEFFAIIILIFLTGVIIYFFYARPLDKLNSKVKNYKRHAVTRTERKDEIGQLQNTFAMLSNELYEEKQAQNRIIASISHDIKTPLTSVLGYSESLLKKELTKERVYQYLQVIHSKARDIEGIVQDFDTYVEGKLVSNLKLQSCRVSFLVEMLLLEYQKELEQQSVKFEVINQLQERETTNIDLPKLRRVFANLIGNAIKHNMNKEQLRITVSILKEGEKTAFCVADNGCGIEGKDLPHIFEPFYTSDESRTVSGLGLSICKNIIEAHGGEIWADALVEGGTAIWFYLE